MSEDKHQQRCDTCAMWTHYYPSLAGIEFGWCCELEEYTEPEDGEDCLCWKPKEEKKP